MREATDHLHYSTVQGADEVSAGNPRMDRRSQARICTNYLLHQHSEFDWALRKLDRGGGARVVLRCLRKRILQEIAAAYPELSEECERQLAGD